MADTKEDASGDALAFPPSAVPAPGQHVTRARRQYREADHNRSTRTPQASRYALR
ncbi:MAG: hypothetical protein JNM58_07400 [Xanthomonadaceae bacterium]|nr:hypothetical protein [Xanthomonadaceae bacterium]